MSTQTLRKTTYDLAAVAATGAFTAALPADRLKVCHLQTGETAAQTAGVGADLRAWYAADFCKTWDRLMQEERVSRGLKRTRCPDCGSGADSNGACLAACGQ